MSARKMFACLLLAAMAVALFPTAVRAQAAGACCLSPDECENLTESECDERAGLWEPETICDGIGQNCGVFHPCSTAVMTGETTCTDPRPSTCDGGRCDGLPCGRGRSCPFNRTCRPATGCSDFECCNEICRFSDSDCCAVGWDEPCALFAQEIDACAHIPVFNDECANAIDLCLPTGITVDTTRATESESDPTFCCTGERGVGTIWYRFVADETSIVLSTCLSDFPAKDSIIQLFEVHDGPGAACCRLRPIACSDDVSAAAGCTPGGMNSRMCVMDLEIGAVYYVMLA